PSSYELRGAAATQEITGAHRGGGNLAAGPEPLQREGVRYDRDGAEPHRGPRENRVEQNPEPSEHARRNGDQCDIVEERPEQVRSDLLHRALAQLDGSDDIPQVVLNQHDPTRLHRDVRPTP